MSDQPSVSTLGITDAMIMTESLTPVARDEGCLLWKCFQHGLEMAFSFLSSSLMFSTGLCISTEWPDIAPRQTLWDCQQFTFTGTRRLKLLSALLWKQGIPEDEFKATN